MKLEYSIKGVLFTTETGDEAVEILSEIKKGNTV